MSSVRLFVFLTVIVAVAACGARRFTQPPAGLDLSGPWRINAEASDDFGVSGGDQEGSRVLVGRPGGGAGGAGRTGGGGARVRGGGPGGARRVPPQLLRAVREFVIVQTDTTVTFRFAAKNSVTVPVNGRKVTTSAWPEVGSLLISARWTEEGLRVERSLPEGGTVVEVFTRAAGTPRLIVTVEIGAQGQRGLQRVYDPDRP